MNEKEKEKYILKFIYRILTDSRNQNRYCTTMFGNLDEEIVDEIIQLGIAEYQRIQALGGVLSERK